MLVISALIFLAATSASLNPAATGMMHEFKMSVCEVIYLPENQAFDLKFYLFQDDFKETLYGNPLAEKIEATAARDYILKHFELIVNGQQQPLSYQDMREKSDQVLLQFTSQKIPISGISKIRVKNSLLLEKFRKQINMMYFLFPEKPKQTLMLNATRTEGELSF